MPRSSAVGRQPRPDRIERLQPRKQLAIERCGNRPRQGLVEMMVGVDQPRQDHVLAGVEYGCSRRRGRCGRRHQFDDAAVLHHNAAFRAVGENSERILDPQRRLIARHGAHPVSSAAAIRGVAPRRDDDRDVIMRLRARRRRSGSERCRGTADRSPASRGARNSRRRQSATRIRRSGSARWRSAADRCGRPRW